MHTVQQGGRVDYNYREIFCDTEAEKNNIQIGNMCPGSVVYIIATGNVYILNSQKQWILQGETS